MYNIPLSPSKQCWFTQDLNAALESIYLKTTLMDASFQLNIVLRGEGMVILRCRPEIYCYHVKWFYWMVFQGLLAKIVALNYALIIRLTDWEINYKLGIVDHNNSRKSSLYEAWVQKSCLKPFLLNRALCFKLILKI